MRKAGEKGNKKGICERQLSKASEEASEKGKREGHLRRANEEGSARWVPGRFWLAVPVSQLSCGKPH